MSGRPDAMDFYVDGDPFDRFPWTVTLYSTEFQDLPEGHRKAFISTANGKRIDNGEQHTYWSVALCQPCVLDALTAEGEHLGQYWEIET